jgi:conjugal transfer mating pair stabilization protein TraG
MPRRSLWKKLNKRFRRLVSTRRLFIVGALVLVAMVSWALMNPSPMIKPTAYVPLLDVIAQGESRGNYNAYFGNAGNTSIRFTDMTLAEVLQWQEQYVAEGNASNAVGRYQIIRPTLEGLIRERNLDLDATFNEPMQDQLAIALLERRGAKEFANDTLSAEQFAYRLSMEWAALPKVVGDAPEDSYYAGDGLNQSRVESAAILNAIDKFKIMAY